MQSTDPSSLYINSLNSHNNFWSYILLLSHLTDKKTEAKKRLNDLPKVKELAGKKAVQIQAV